MAEIQFYHLSSTPLERALPRLLEKALQGGLRAVVLTGSEEKAEWLSTMLWTYDPASFLPHGTEKDGYAEAQPVFITATAQNPNGAGLLVVTDGSEIEFSESVARVLDLCDGSDAQAVEKAQLRAGKYRAAGHRVVINRQNASGGWEKQALAAEAAA